MNELTLGTKEHVILDVTDQTKNITDLAGSNARYDWRLKVSGTWLGQNLPATVIGMRVYCLIDTTLAGVDTGKYELYVSFSATPEQPRLGPFNFEVNP
jgi:hypothetical protein